MIGDAVNTAARVEAATRETGDEILITDATRRRLSDPRFEFDQREAISLKGKAQEVRLWAPRSKTREPIVRRSRERVAD